MDNVSVTNLESQEYFKSDQISNDQKRMIFKYRTMMERFGENFCGGKNMVIIKFILLNKFMVRKKENSENAC
jgi:hypothetical protein